MKLCPNFSPFTNNKSKWMKDLKARAKILKLLEQNTSRHRHGQGFSENNSNAIGNTFKNWQVGLCETKASQNMKQSSN